MEFNINLREHTTEILETFILDKVKESGADGIVLGLSGGLDSAVVAKLSVDAIGSKKVLALMMPASERQKNDTMEAVELAKKLHILYKIIDIAPMIECVASSVKGINNKVAIGNVAARTRMILLYCHANSMNRLVMGTGNKSELLMGYFTKYGDGGADYLPLGDLYKTQVRELARKIKIPDKFIIKPPSAGFWKGQTDESEMGIKYGDLDKILYGIELNCTENEIHERTGISLEKIIHVHKQVKHTVHKRKMPLIPKIGIRTLGADWRE